MNIDSNGDGKPDLNIDTDNDGRPDLNLVDLSKETPEGGVRQLDVENIAGVNPVQ